MNQTTTQEILDTKIYKTIQEYCNTRKHPVRAEEALLAFDFLSKRASAEEIRAHKGEYLFLFRRLIHSLPCVSGGKGRSPFRTETEQYAPKIIELTDWFIAQRGCKDGPYKTKLKDLLHMIEEKHVPVHTSKWQTWQECLTPKRKISLKNCKAEQPAKVYRCSFFGRGINHRLYDKD